MWRIAHITEERKIVPTHHIACYGTAKSIFVAGIATITH
jgi:hypothetical protein